VQSLLVLLGLFAALLVIAWLLRGLMRTAAEPAPRLADQTAAHQTTTGRKNTMVHVIAVITAKPGKREEILAHFRDNVPNVLNEEGCIEYAAAVDAAPPLLFQTPFGPETFVVVEKWASLDALKAHAAAPHMAAYAAKTKEHIATRIIHVLSPA
jgi:quinol monooxygenase YgiN